MIRDGAESVVVMRVAVYLVGAPITPSFGEYSYRSITPEEARRALAKGFVSAVWDKWAADMIRDTLNIDVPVSRRQVGLEAGDIAVVFQIRGDPQEAVPGEPDSPYCVGLLERRS